MTHSKSIKTLFLFVLSLTLLVLSVPAAQAQLPPGDCTTPSNARGQDDDSQGRDAPGCIRSAMKRRYDFAVISRGYLQNTIRYYDHTDVYYYDYGRTRSSELNVPYCVKWKAPTGSPSPLPTSYAKFYVWASRSGSSSGLKRIGTVGTAGFTFKFSSAQRVYFSINTSYRGGHYGFSITRNKTCGSTYNSCPTRCSSNSDCASCQGKGKCDLRTRKCIADTNKCGATPGYYCLSTVKLSCGSSQYYCPGDGSRKTVSSGHYSTGGTSSRYRTGQKVCEKGYYCTSGVRYKCPTGTTTSGTGATSKTQCKGTTCVARAGYYCSGGRPVACGGNQYYCPGGTNATRRTVSTGYYSTGGTSTTRTGQRSCPAGRYCQGGVSRTCPAGTYQNLTGQTSCKKCASGTYQNLVGQTSCKKCQTGSCSAGVGACKKTGTYTCDPVKGSVCPVKAGTPEKDICDGKDNDCDGKTDEDFTTLGNACNSGQGACQASGKFVCKADGSGVECDAKPGTGSKELCDGKDNDCDGRVDEDFPNKNNVCTIGVGACKSSGKYICKTDGSGLECQAKLIQPGKEVCDGKDNDCDGKVDEDGVCAEPTPEPTPDGGSTDAGSPDTGTTDGGSADTGTSDGGTTDASPTDTGSTDGGTTDAGTADGGATDGGTADSVPDAPKNTCKRPCAADEFCRKGQCVKACGCLRCGEGQSCKDGQCVSDACAGKECPTGELCDPQDGQCKKNGCETVKCGKGKVCQFGQCIADPCGSIQCPGGMSCQNGQCVQSNCSDEPTTDGTAPSDAGPATDQPAQTDQGGKGPGSADKNTGNAGDTPAADKAQATGGGCEVLDASLPVEGLLVGLFLLLLGIRIRRKH